MAIDSLVTALAPTGKLRASINLGNPILAKGNVSTGEPYGVSVDLARELAKRLEVELELLIYDTARKSVDAVNDGRADIGFFAIDPLRGAGIAFTSAYVLIEGVYLKSNADVDLPANRVVVGKGTAYDLFLTRELKAAQIVRASTSQAVVQTFVEGGYEVAAGVRQQLEADLKGQQGLRLLEERFMVIQQAMGTPKTRGRAAADYLSAFIEEMKTSQFVGQSLARHGIVGARVAPAA
jgi:polar amino acid transport system substrate-binding protein